MSISFIPMIHDHATDAWLMLDAARDEPDSFEVNVTNANGADLLLALALTPKPSGELPIDHFAGLVTTALRRHLGRRSPELAETTDTAPGRMAMIFCGRREGYVEQRLGDLAALTQRGRAVGATHISWG